MSQILLPAGRRPALIINECQRGVLDPTLTSYGGLAEQAASRNIVPRIIRLASAFRRQALPVIHSPVIHREDMAGVTPNSLIDAISIKKRSMRAGSEEARYVDGLEPEPGDHVIDRPAGLIGFLATILDVTLRRLGVDTVVLTGVSTNVAMPGNTMAAVDFGYHVIIPEDCVAGSDADTHRVIMDHQLRMLARIGTSDDLIAAIERPNA